MSITTENNAVSYSTTGDARLDLFFKTVRNTPENELVSLVEKSWNVNPLDTLKILFHLRDCRGGKGERKQFYTSMKWVLKAQPTAFVANIDNIHHFGRYKDLLEFLGTNAESLIVHKFAHQLLLDKTSLQENAKEITLAAKYAPTEGCFHDRTYDAVQKFCSAMGITKKQYRKEFLVPLRKHLRIVEAAMCNKKWEDIDFSKLPSVALKKYKSAWKSHCEDRYATFLKRVTEGKTKMNVARLHPHEILKDYATLLHCVEPTIDPTIEVMWTQFVKNLREKTTIKNALAIVDVSGSMNGLPLQVAVSLGMLIAELNEGSFHDCFLSFSSTPTIEKLRGDTVCERVTNMIKTHWDMSTNIQGAFDIILNTAKMFNTPETNMPRTLFILSDMQFDVACPRNNVTNWDEIERKYREAGYKRPHIVFWNLRGDTIDFPVTKDVPNCSMISGFSADLLEMFTDGEELNPYSLMRKTIDRERYSRVKITTEGSNGVTEGSNE